MIENETLETAIASTRRVLAGTAAEHLDQPTPCASWDVAALINHIVGGQQFFADLASGNEPGPRADHAAGDYLAAFDHGSQGCLAAFAADGAMERIVHAPFGDVPGSVMVRLAATDTFTHGWDLARATGQSTDLAPDLAAGILESIRPMVADTMRGADGQANFGPEREAPAGASNADRLAAFLGREV